jgi:hypothetical protein
LRCVYQMKKPLFLSSMTRPSNKLKLNSFNIFSSLINNIIINNLQIRERERGKTPRHRAYTCHTIISQSKKDS